MNFRFSILITVYNKEQYLKKCLDSVVNQTYRNFDIVIVDDGSTDKSKKNIKKYMLKHGNIKYFYQDNKGVSSVRNECIKHVTNEYFLFVDADDYIDKNLLCNLNKELCKDSNLDILSFNMTEVSEENKIIRVLKKANFAKCSGEEAFIKYIINDNYVYFDTPWGYVYNTAFWKKNKFEYIEGKVHEDSLLTPIVILSASSVISTKIQGYYYVQSLNSITRVNNQDILDKRVDDLFNNYKILIDFVNSYKLKEENRINILRHIAYVLLKIPYHFNLSDKKKYFKKMKQIKFYKLIYTKIGRVRSKILKVIAFINIKLFYYIYKSFEKKSIFII